jgi:hypothetical protein
MLQDTTTQLPLDSDYTPEDTLNYSLIKEVSVGNYNTVDILPATPSLDSGVLLETLEGRTVCVTGVATTPDGVYTLGFNADLGLLITESSGTRDVHHGTNALDTVSNDDYDPGINQR